MPKKAKLNYRFHNPNTPETAADYIEKVFMEANVRKVEIAIQNAANQCAVDNKPLSSGSMQVNLVSAKERTECRVPVARDIAHKKSLVSGR